MTNVVLKIDDDDIYLDALNHSESPVICAMVSTLTNVLIVAGYMEGVEPKTYDKTVGHIVLNIPNAKESTIHTAKCVDECFRQIAEQYPDFVRKY